MSDYDSEIYKLRKEIKLEMGSEAYSFTSSSLSSKRKLESVKSNLKNFREKNLLDNEEVRSGIWSVGSQNTNPSSNRRSYFGKRSRAAGNHFIFS